MKTMLPKNKFVEHFLNARYEEDRVKFQKDPLNKGKESTFGATKEGEKLLMQQALAMYQLYLGTAGLPDPVKQVNPALVKNDPVEYTLFQYLESRVVNTILMNVLMGSAGDSVDVKDCLTQDFEAALKAFKHKIDDDKNMGIHIGKRISLLAAALVNYVNFFKTHASPEQFVEAVVVSMTFNAEMELHPAHTPSDLFKFYWDVVMHNRPKMQKQE